MPAKVAGSLKYSTNVGVNPIHARKKTKGEEPESKQLGLNRISNLWAIPLFSNVINIETLLM